MTRLNFSSQFPRKLIPFITAVVLVILLNGCNRSAVNTQSQSSTETITSSKPPFQTKEPEQYRAVRVITTTDGQTGTVATSKSVRIARDGTDRREEYDTDAGDRLVYLENSSGSFVLFPAARIYADLNARRGDVEGTEALEGETAHAADGLLNQVGTEATYRKLGTEQLGERSTTKYRVSYTNSPNGTTQTRETYVWVDESLGMPVRSETSYVSAGNSSKVVVELREISLEVDQRLFALPPDYKSVAYRDIADRIRAPKSK